MADGKKTVLDRVQGLGKSYSLDTWYRSTIVNKKNRIEIYLKEEGSPFAKDGKLTKQEAKADKSENAILTGFNAIPVGSFGVMCQSCEGLQLGAIHLQNAKCKEDIDLMALAVNNGWAKGNDSFNIFSPNVSRWKNTMKGQFEEFFREYDDPMADDYPGKWTKVKQVDNRTNIVFQEKSTATHNKLFPAT